MQTNKTSNEQFNRLKEFRQTTYSYFIKAADASFELIDAVLSTSTARSYADLTTALAFRHGWSSAYKALCNLERNERGLLNLRVELIPKDKPLIFAIDATVLSRATAHTLEERTFVFTPASLPGVDSITAGHSYSTVAYLAEKGTSWALPLIQQRVKSSETTSAKAVEQINLVRTVLPTQDLLFLLDSGYANKTLLEINSSLKVKMLIRWRSNSNLYREPEVDAEGQKKRRRKHGKVFKVNDPTTHGQSDETKELQDETLGPVRVELWRNLHIETCSEVKVQLMCVRQLKARTKRARKPLWVIWVGKDMPPLVECWRTYLLRYGIEHWYRFSKQYLYWSLPKVATVNREENWNELVVMSMWMLWLSRGIADDRPKPWQKRQEKEKMTPGRVKAGMGIILAVIGTPTKECKVRGKAPGWKKGRKRTKRKVHEVIRRGEQRKRSTISKRSNRKTA